MTLDKLVGGLIKTLKLMESNKIDPALLAMVGILPHDIDVDAARLGYLTSKYLRDEGPSVITLHDIFVSIKKTPILTNRGSDKSMSKN